MLLQQIIYPVCNPFRSCAMAAVPQPTIFELLQQNAARQFIAAALAAGAARTIVIIVRSCPIGSSPAVVTVHDHVVAMWVDQVLRPWPSSPRRSRSLVLLPRPLWQQRQFRWQQVVLTLWAQPGPSCGPCVCVCVCVVALSAGVAGACPAALGRVSWLKQPVRGPGGDGALLAADATIERHRQLRPFRLLEFGPGRQSYVHACRLQSTTAFGIAFGIGGTPPLQ